MALQLGAIPAGADLLWCIVEDASGQSSLALPSEEEQATAQVGSYFLIPIPMNPKVEGRIAIAVASDSEILILEVVYRRIEDTIIVVNE
jgi:hypothetical protein